MNKYYKAVASAMVAFSMLLTAVVAPVNVLAQSNFGFSNSDFGGGFGSGFGSNTNTTDFGNDFSAEYEAAASDSSSDGSSASAGQVSDDGSSASAGSNTYVRCGLNSVTGNTIFVGGEVTLNWNTDNTQSVTINGEAVSNLSGSKTIKDIRENTQFVLRGTDGNGSSCEAIVFINCLPPEVPKNCQLQIHKVVDKADAVIGDQVTYTITVKNTGDADCTGGGVKIEDIIDPNLVYKSNTVSSNLSAGYGNKPVYTNADRTLRFNGHDLTPGEQGTITWIGEVSAPTQCGDFVVKNQAKTTAKELNDFGTWVNSNIVTTNIDNDCGEVIVKPQCPYTAADGTVIDWSAGDNRIFSSRGEAKSRTTAQAVNLPAGDYSVRLVAWDGYEGRQTVSQPNEKYKVVLANGATIVAQSNDTQDLADNVKTALFNGQVNAKLTLASNVTSVYALHSVYPDNTSPNSLNPICAVFTPEEPEVEIPAPTCDMFKATPSTITLGDKALLEWNTSNATEVFLNNAIGKVDADGSIEVSPIVTTTYKLTVNGADNKSVNCEVPVTVSEDKVPACEFFTATPASLPVGGGDVTLAWKITNGLTASITPAIGSVLQEGTRVVNVTQGTTYELTAEDNNGDKVTCPAPITVADPTPVFTCEQNVNFSISDSSIDRGDDTTLTWSTTNVDSLTISNINATTLSGSQTVSPASDTTYTLAATQGNKTINCPVSVNVSSGGGGGGGSSSPRCDLDISDSKITLGDEITLTWDTSRATEVTLADDEGEILFTTDDFLSKDKEEYYDGSITIKPTRDTKYTILAQRGSRDRTCSVEVEIEDNVVVLETRDQQPLVAGISLTQVPYTGFEAGPFMTYLFYLLLGVWSLFITYLLVMRNRAVPAMVASAAVVNTRKEENATAMKKAEAARPDVFTPSVMSKVVASQTAPANLPTGIQFAGQDVMKTTTVHTNPHQVDDAVVTELENRAHEQNALLSSDSIRHFIATTAGSVERNEALDSVISEAKKSYPLEDGWVVINEARMQSLCEVCQVNAEAQKEEAFVPSTIPTGSGSLAEAIVTGNVVAAYEMIGNRPMFSVADAAADLDAVYRNRKGANETVSDMLKKESANLSDEQIKNMITALTGALDGTYTDEASAVKMAIMKAVKAAA